MLGSIRNELYYIAQTVSKSFSHDYSAPLTSNLNGRGLPMIMIHGSSGNQLEWAGPWDRICEAFPNNPCFAFSLDVPFNSETGKQECDYGYFGLKRLEYLLDRSIDDYAHELESRVRYVRAKYDNKRVILFGHSMGGLVPCAYKNQNEVAGIVTFCSPLRGTPRLENWLVQKVLTTTRHREMTPGSALLARISENVRNQAIFSVGSENDWQVPADYSRFENQNHVYINSSGHLSITNDEAALISVTT